MATDKEQLEKEIKQITEIIGNCEYRRITATNDVDEYDIIEQTGIWQGRLMRLEKQYRELGGNRNDR